MIKPERNHTLIMSLGADSRANLANALEMLAYDIRAGKLNEGCYGSPSSGAIYSLKVLPEQTHDKYFSDIEEWLNHIRSGEEG